MGQMSWRTLVTILSVCTLALGLVGLSETVHPTRTALGPSSLAIRLFGPVIAAVGLGLFAMSRRVAKKAYPRPVPLVVTGLLALASPFAIWIAGALLAPDDSAIWAPMVAVASFLLALPGAGMAFGGLRRLREPDPAPARPGPPARVKRRR